ncbi:MAG: hypothetical protein AB7I41_21735 [Candidatus Sericytochromatia bacterium]
MIGLYLLFPGFFLGLLSLLQLQVGELLPFLNAPPQFLLMGGLLLCLILPRGASLWMVLCFAALLDLWANSGVFQLSIALLSLAPVWGYARRSEKSLSWPQACLAALWVTLSAELGGALWYAFKGAWVWEHLLHILPPLLFYHLLMLIFLYPAAKLILKPISEAKL